jgi:hypothetical protein
MTSSHVYIYCKKPLCDFTTDEDTWLECRNEDEIYIYFISHFSLQVHITPCK